MVSQNVLNLVDAAMVGSLGDAALAATGMGSFANFMGIAFITGLSSGVQAMSARRLGEERLSETAVPLNGGLLMALLLGLPWCVVLYLATPWFFPFLVDDPLVVEQGVPYLQARLLAMVAVGMNFSFRGYWNGVNLSRLYMRTLVLMHLTNISLNYVLIYGKLGFPAYGAEGAGMASAASTWIGLLYYVYLGLRHAREGGFLRGLPDPSTLRTMLRISLPSSAQQLFFAAGMTALFKVVSLVGTSELAAANVLVQLLLVAILPGMAFGIAAASLVGQALGRGKPEDAMRWGWDVCKLAAVLVGLFALPGAVVPELILAPFLHNPETLALAAWPLRVVALFMAVDTVGMVLLNALLGAGDSRRVMLVSIALQWGLFLPAAYLVGPVLGYGLLGIWVAQVAYRALQSGVLAALWQGGRWQQIEV
ncbi:MAG: MATE family efflux transporter [Alphaproteobacteria bacterium]|nr:MATE family efflux transporter [Alphaproteobacteria bacterium]MCB9791640.1 MATE family efflux transporter [Alphaproteobacteria bacterium]